MLSVVAPAAADRRATELWVTLPTGARRHDNRPDGLPSTLTRVDVPRGGQVVVEVWSPAGAADVAAGAAVPPVVYLVHGWGGWRGQLGAFVAPLVAAGYRVVAADAPSHGESAPGFLGVGRGAVMELIETLEAVGARFGPAAGIVAHSLGCTASAEAIGAGLSARRLVLLAPNHSFEEVVDGFATLLRLRERTTNHLRTELERYTGRPLADYDLARAAAAGAMPPTLVVHDRQDKEAPLRASEVLVAAWPDARLVVTDGLGHQRILADPAVVAEVVAFVVGGADGPGPSAASLPEP